MILTPSTYMWHVSIVLNRTFSVVNIHWSYSITQTNHLLHMIQWPRGVSHAAPLTKNWTIPLMPKFWASIVVTEYAVNKTSPSVAAAFLSASICSCFFWTTFLSSSWYSLSLSFSWLSSLKHKQPSSLSRKQCGSKFNHCAETHFRGLNIFFHSQKKYI